jgi:hypothetical protein
MRWKHQMIITLVLILGLPLVGSGCGATTLSGSSSSSTESSSDSSSGSSDSAASDSDALTTPSAGETGLFISVSSGSADTITAGGSSLTIESGTSYIYRLLLTATNAARLDTTLDLYNNFSCDSAGDQRPYTSGQKLYNVEVCPDIDDGQSTLDVERVNPSTGAIITTCSNIASAGTSPYSAYMAVTSDTLYYRNSSGALVTRDMSASTCGDEVVLLSASEDDNGGAIYIVNGTLVTVLSPLTTTHTIRTHATSTGAITATLETITAATSNDAYTFYEGDDALYWMHYNSSTYVLGVYRYPLTGTPELIHSTTLSDAKIASAVDASGGKVLIMYKYVATRNDADVATAWTTVGKLYDVIVGTTTDVTLNDFIDNLMQIMVYE